MGRLDLSDCLCQRFESLQEIHRSNHVWFDGGDVHGQSGLGIFAIVGKEKIIFSGLF